MISKEMKEKAIKSINEKGSLKYLGSGISRTVYALNRKYVIKIEKYYSDIPEILEQMPENLLVKKLTDRKKQNIIEFENWEKIKNSELKIYVSKVIGVFFYQDKLVLLQERGKKIKFGMWRKNRKLIKFKTKMLKEFRKKGYTVTDAHIDNFVIQNRKYKLCDIGYTKI